MEEDGEIIGMGNSPKKLITSKVYPFDSKWNNLFSSHVGVFYDLDEINLNMLDKNKVYSSLS